MKPELLAIIAANEQDREHAKQWWRETPTIAKIAIWTWLQQPFDDPLLQAVANLAAMKMAELTEEASRNDH